MVKGIVSCALIFGLLRGYFPLIQVFSSLHCDAECRRIGRNKAVAEALNIKTDREANRVDIDGVSGVASSMYTDFLKSYLKANFKHVQAVEDILIGLVHELENVSFFNSSV